MSGTAIAHASRQLLLSRAASERLYKGMQMKKLLAIVALVVSVHQASATSLLGNVLQYDSITKLAGGVSHSLSVYVDGQVVHRTMQAVPNGMKAEKMMTLTRTQMDKINKLVKASTPAIKKFEPSLARCFAPSNVNHKYSASNTSLFLREGDVCAGGFTVNVKPAAKKLVSVLGILEQGYHNKTNLAEVEKKLNAVLQ
jgi:hypothetical protein